jgi:hypothetical protein
VYKERGFSPGNYEATVLCISVKDVRAPHACHNKRSLDLRPATHLQLNSDVLYEIHRSYLRNSTAGSRQPNILTLPYISASPGTQSSYPSTSKLVSRAKARGLQSLPLKLRGHVSHSRTWYRTVRNLSSPSAWTSQAAAQHQQQQQGWSFCSKQPATTMRSTGCRNPEAGALHRVSACCCLPYYCPMSTAACPDA